jgi:magnesium-transporting ATPase (P-type)
VASDKTGTLTRNEMTVQGLWAVGRPERELLRAGVLCNDATAGAGGTAALGDPTEVALIEAARRHGVDPHAERAAYPRLAAVPFDAGRRLMATVRARPDGGTVLHVKGAPEAVLPRCRPEGRDAAVREIDPLTDGGQRVLVFATCDDAAPADLDEQLEGLRLLGLAAMIDPPRDGAADAVAACHEAGVRVIMITGDHPRTARAIGVALGLSGDSAVTGSELDELDQEALRRRAASAEVYARVAPEHKLRLVRVLQAGGDVVAMTGDGVNDAPALRQADIGVAMGLGGTAAAKEAADVVLADDDFSTLRAAVEEGRRVYDNLVKALSFVLPISIGQALIVAVAVLAFPWRTGHRCCPSSRSRCCG